MKKLILGAIWVILVLGAFWATLGGVFGKSNWWAPVLWLILTAATAALGNAVFAGVGQPGSEGRLDDTVLWGIRLAVSGGVSGAIVGAIYGMVTGKTFVVIVGIIFCGFCGSFAGGILGVIFGSVFGGLSRAKDREC